MKTITKEPVKLAKKMGLVGVGLCALCCALPMIGIAGGAGILAIVALYAEKIALMFLLSSVVLFAIWKCRKRPPACSIDCDCKTENATPENTTDLN